MSPWPRDRVMAWLAPSALVLARLHGRGSRERWIAQVERTLDAVQDPRDWRACTAVLEAELVRVGWQRSELRVCVSDHFVRYALLRWRDGLRGPQEWEAYARHELESSYGTCDRARTIRIAPARQGASRLAAAIDADLIAEIRRIASAAKLALAAIEPNLCRVANRFRRTFPKSGGALAISEPGRMSLLRARNDDWTELQSVRAAPRSVETLVSLVLQARCASGDACREIMLWGELPDEADTLARHGIEATRLGPAVALPRPCLPLGLI